MSPTHGRYRAQSLLSEAWRNLASGASLALVLATCTAFTVLALGELENQAVSALDSKARSYVDSGASTYVLTSEANIDPAACERLTETTRVDIAGALRRGQSVGLTTLPAAPVQVSEVTPGFISFLQVPPIQRAGVLVSEGLAEEVMPDNAARQNSARPRQVPPLTVAGVYPWPEDGRSADLQYAVVAPVPKTGRFDQCWARSVDPADKPLDLLLTTLVRPPDSPGDAVPAQLNRDLGEAFTARTDFETRGTRYAWMIAGISVLLVAMTALRRRATELTNAKDCGIPIGAIATQMTLEALIWAALGSTIALSALTIANFTHGKGDIVWDLLALDTRVAVSAISGALVGSALGVKLILRKPTEHYLRTR